jgi:hypothetical protein
VQAAAGRPQPMAAAAEAAAAPPPEDAFARPREARRPHPLPPARAAAVAAVEAHVRAALGGNDASHDWQHIERVRANALRIAADEQARALSRRRCYKREGFPEPEGPRRAHGARGEPALAEAPTIRPQPRRCQPRLPPIRRAAPPRATRHARDPQPSGPLPLCAAGQTPSQLSPDQAFAVELGALMHDLRDWKYEAAGADTHALARAEARVRGAGRRPAAPGAPPRAAGPRPPAPAPGVGAKGGGASRCARSRLPGLCSPP